MDGKIGLLLLFLLLLFLIINRFDPYWICGYQNLDSARDTQVCGNSIGPWDSYNYNKNMVLSRVVMIRGCTRIAGCVGLFGFSVWNYWIIVLHGKVSFELKLSDVSWLSLNLMCDTNYDAPLAEDLIISGSLQCIDPDRIATFNSRTGVELAFFIKKYDLEEEKVCNLMGRAVVYEIEDLIGHMWTKKPCGHYGIKYEIKWAGYEATTFEPLDNIPSNVVGCARVKTYNMANVQHVCRYCGYQRAFSTASGLKRHETGCRHKASRILSA